MTRVLVTDGEQRSTLAVVRSLGKAGNTVLVGGAGKRFLSERSRFCDHSVSLAPSLQEPERFVSSVLSCIREHEVDVILPMTEGSLTALSQHRDLIEGAILPVPAHSVLERILQKESVSEVARSVGLSAPEQRILESSSDDLPSDINFPTVVKPSRSVVGPPGKREKVGISYAADRGELELELSRLPAAAWPILLQERIVGPGVGLFFLIWNDKVMARFAHRRIREKPPSGGVSVLREAVDVPEDWFEKGANLLREMEWYGIAMVELKQDLNTGRPYVMEVNPRFWGSLQLAIDAGVDFPALFLSAIHNEEKEPVLSYRSGVQTRWVMGDFDHLLLRLTRSREFLSLPPGAPGRIQTLFSFFSALKPSVRNEVFRISDPLPGIYEAVRWVRDL